MSTRMKIVIGYDGSDCANRALAERRRAGLPPDTEAMIVSIGWTIALENPATELTHSEI